jgi:hypothetical protein
MPIFACRWPNGDLSILAAKDKDDATCRLDEIDNAETAHVFRVDDFLLDLKLVDDGTLATDGAHGFGEVCGTEIMASAYPILWAARRNLSSSATDQEASRVVTQAVQQERNRMGPVPASVPIDPKLRALKEMTGMPDALLRKLRPKAGPKRKL